MSSWHDSPSNSSSSRKRKRVTRACDECRKKKVKCDGQMPCLHCTAYSYECTYDQPSVRRKVPDSLRLENRLRNAESVIEALLPGVDIHSTGFDLSSLLDYIKRNRSEGHSPPSILANIRINSPRFHRSSASASPDVPRELSSPGSADGQEFKIILPPKHVAIQLIECTWENACVLFRFYHRPSFIRDLDLLYETDPEDYSDKQHKILPLMYSVMAVGVLFSMNKAKELGIRDSEEGYQYFAAARRLIDITDARDMYSIQSIVMMVLFLQCSAKLSTCYTWIGLAYRAALRAGLHRKLNHKFNPIEMESRKRLFWTIRKMDLYLNAMLGLPTGDDSDFDQEYPVDIDDENVTEDGYFPQAEGKLSSAGIANAHTKLMLIVGHIMRGIYHLKSQDSATLYENVARLEGEIQDWYKALPPYLVPGADVPTEYKKANLLLSMSYWYTQILLYRRFIHVNELADDRAKEYAQKCIDVARGAIYTANDLVSNSMLNGAYWFSVYTLFFAVACLVYFTHHFSRTSPEYSAELRVDAELGRECLLKLKHTSHAAERTYNLLNNLFEQLNKRLLQKEEEKLSVAEISYKSERGLTSKDTLLPDEEPAAQAAAAQPFSDVPMGMDFSNVLPPVTGATAAGATLNPISTTTMGPSPYLYSGGLMDQVDQQLFGRFLPPDMMGPSTIGPVDNMSLNFMNMNGLGATTDAPAGGGVIPVSQPSAAAVDRRDSVGLNNGMFFNAKEWDDFMAKHIEISGVNSNSFQDQEA